MIPLPGSALPSRMAALPLRPGPGASVDIDLLVVPRASQSRVVGLHGDRLRVQLAAPPVDGAANDALLDLFAERLDLPRARLLLVRGATGKRKTLRVDLGPGRAAPALADLAGGDARLGLPADPSPPVGLRALVALLLTLPAACADPVEVALKVILPEDAADLDRADNAALALDPDGLIINYGVDGTDFALSLELERDDVQRTLTLYLARGADLLAWGRSAPFVLARGDEPLALFLGRPGALSTFPGAIAAPEPDLLAAEAPGRGALFLAPDGGTYLFSERTLTVAAGAALDLDDLPAPSDGALIGAASGHVLRLSFAGDAPRGWGFDPGADAWTPLTFTGALDLGPRPGAAALVDAPRASLLLFGGGDRADIVEIALVPGDDGDHSITRLDLPLDAPRPGARATWILRTGTDAGEGALLFGSDDPALPAALFLPADGAVAAPLGPPGPWQDAACAPVDLDPGEADPLRVICLGGVRGESATADALLLTFPPPGLASAIEAAVLPEWLPQAMPDPRLFADNHALYAQSGDLWLRIDRGDLTRVAAQGPARRARGGHSVSLGTGVRVLLGGIDADGDPVDRWQVFTPALP